MVTTSIILALIALRPQSVTKLHREGQRSSLIPQFRFDPQLPTTVMISCNFRQIHFKVLYFSIFIVMTILSALPMANADDGTIEKSGTCSKGSKWKLSLSPDDSRIDVDFEAENTVLVEQKWKIDNKKTVFQKTVAAGSLFGDGINDVDQDEDEEEDEDEDFDEEDDDTIHVFDINTDILNTIGKWHAQQLAKQERCVQVE
jgi:hypothetical protein